MLCNAALLMIQQVASLVPPAFRLPGIWTLIVLKFDVLSYYDDFSGVYLSGRFHFRRSDTQECVYG